MLTTLDQRVIGSLRDKSLRRPGSGPRIAVVANCQNFSIAYAMKLLNVEATVHPFPVMFKPWISIKTLIRALKLYDYVFLQPFGPRYVRGGTSDTIISELKNPVLFPTIVFTGFHPDQIYVEDRTLDDNARIGGPLGPYHSALAFFAYRAGLPVDAALRLFTREIFEAVGYFDVWNEASDAFVKEGEKFSLDFREDLLRWTRRGLFMYSSIHPKPFVFLDVARRLMEKAGIPVTPINYDGYAVDDLVRGVVYPVYPEIAEFYGFSGSYIFKGAHFSLTHNVGEFWNLRQFITDCYGFYAKYQPNQLTNERVEKWLGDTEASDFLLGMAGAQRRGGSSPSGGKRGAADLAVEPSLG
jgi:hypothetical protein